MPSFVMWLREVWGFHKFPLKCRLIRTRLHEISILFLKVPLISCFIKQSFPWKLCDTFRICSSTDFEKFNLCKCAVSQKAFHYCTIGEKEMEEDTKTIRIAGLDRTQMGHYFETSRDTREETWCMSWRRNVPQHLLHICLAICLYAHCAQNSIAATLQASDRFTWKNAKNKKRVLAFPYLHVYCIRLPAWGLRNAETIFKNLKLRNLLIFIEHLLTYLLTYSMEQSPYWEATWFCS